MKQFFFEEFEMSLFDHINETCTKITENYYFDSPMRGDHNILEFGDFYAE